MNRRGGKSSDRISLKVTVAVCVLSFIAGVAYTKADRTVMLLSSIATEPQATGTPAQDVAADPHVQQVPKVQVAHPTSLPEGQETNAQSSEWRTVRMRVTGYCPCPKCCGQYSDGITANGHKIQPGDTFVAADRRYAFGTEMLIPGYNNGQVVKVLDRGGAIRGNKLDAFFHTHQAALEWGVKYLDVKVREN
ncbi:MAG: 3D domain-containing protein [Phycisphaerales bacterium]|nr:MAG: 3D domain-containing protein [Phycisphaerales bacterium]